MALSIGSIYRARPEMPQPSICWMSPSMSSAKDLAETSEDFLLSPLALPQCSRALFMKSLYAFPDTAPFRPSSAVSGLSG